MDTPVKAHLRFGGSSAERWLNCTASVQMEEQQPPQIENEYMAEGTRAHALLETALRDGTRTVLDFEDDKLKPTDPAFTADDVEAVQVALDYVYELLDKTKDHELYIERFVTADVAGEPVGGTADVMIYDPFLKTLHVIDYKHGRGKYVDAEDNKQMKLYAMCALFSFTDHPVETIKTTIIQPRCSAGAPIRAAVYGVADLISYSDDVDAAVIEAKSPDAKLVPGSWCKWCKAGHVCPALRDNAVEVITTPVYRPPVGEEVHIILPAPGRLTDPGALAMALKPAELIKAWADAVEDQARSLALAGVTIPGYKLVEKRATRRWGDEEAARQWAWETGLDENVYAPRKLLSVAQFEKSLKGRKEDIKKMAAFVEKKSSGYNLVPIEAKGDAVNPLLLAEDEFTTAVTIEN